MNNSYQDMYYDHAGSRSPGSQRHPQQSLHRQTSRQFDAYGQMPNAAYAPDDQPQRFDTNRFDRMNTGLSAGTFGGYDVGASQTWNPNTFGASPAFNAFGGSRTMKPPNRGRSNLPPAWFDQHGPPMPNISQLGGIGQSILGNQSMRSDSFQQDSDEELIPTAIVIKNIPFAVKKEQLVELMTSLNLPLPYAFNYHFDNGVFRGLAFANFTSPEETATVIENLNHFELHGRKLRVEYKKMLPVQERERIEREKRERRGQLEEQHRPIPTPSLQTQHSMSSLSSHVPATSPSPVSARQITNVDLNDPENLAFYTQILLFKQDTQREALIFPSTLTPLQRRTVHTLAHLMVLSHVSVGSGDQRQVHVLRSDASANASPPLSQGPTMHGDPSRRLNRAATTDFSEARGSDPTVYAPLRAHQSSTFLGIPESPSGFNNQQNLRAAKSFADLRSYTPSPAQSSASFPVDLQTRFQNAVLASGASGTPTLNNAASGTLGQHSSESLLVNGLSNMTIGTSIGAGSPRRLRSVFSFEDNQGNSTGPIGSNRNFAMASFDEPNPRDRSQILPARQPRGPIERGPGFARGRQNQNGHQARGSDELRQQSSNVEIIVE